MRITELFTAKSIELDSAASNRDEILSRLRGHDADVYTRAIDILVSRIRRKREPLDCIKTLRNAGYTFAGARQP